MDKRVLLAPVLLKATCASAFPNVCTVLSNPAFDSCLDFSAEPDVCGTPPYPCARVSYYVPSTFVEVVASGKDTFFRDLPFASMQMSSGADLLPYAEEASAGAYSYQAHALTVPFVTVPFATLACGDAPIDRFCFSAMSEDIKTQWRSGSADMLQPKYLTWSVSPKACILAGAATSLTGTFGSVGVDAKLCSFNHDWLTRYPPSLAPVCTGWGIHFPRSGTVTSSDQTTASLVIASRIKTLGSEVFTSVPSALQEKWSMVYPNSTSCFREGENIAKLVLKNVNESGRITKAMPKNYLYTSWQKVTCWKPWLAVPAMQVALQAARAACQGVQ